MRTEAGKGLSLDPYAHVREQVRRNQTVIRAAKKAGLDVSGGDAAWQDPVGVFRQRHLGQQFDDFNKPGTTDDKKKAFTAFLNAPKNN